ncbi:MAG: hypothetical protein GYA87_02750 [Christensenellaceae bacterium]|nr:hypothetical protein [Christensenellaceae bacterium]
MKKLIALVLALVLSLGVISITNASTSFNSQEVYIYSNYSKVLIPDYLKKMELSDEEWDYGYVLRYESEDGGTIFTYANYTISNTPDIDEYADFLKEVESAENIEKFEVNGREALYFEKDGNSFYVGMHLGDENYDELGITLKNEQNITKSEAEEYVKEIFESFEEVVLDESVAENIEIDPFETYKGVWFADEIINRQYYIPENYIQGELSEDMRSSGFTCTFYPEDKSQFYTTHYSTYDYDYTLNDAYFIMNVMGYTDIEPVVINGKTALFGILDEDLDLVYIEPTEEGAIEYTFTTSPDNKDGVEEGVKLIVSVLASFTDIN